VTERLASIPLSSAIDLANLDWRDLLVEAGFANDARAHFGWEP